MSLTGNPLRPEDTSLTPSAILSPEEAAEQVKYRIALTDLVYHTGIENPEKSSDSSLGSQIEEAKAILAHGGKGGKIQLEEVTRNLEGTLGTTPFSVGGPDAVSAGKVMEPRIELSARDAARNADASQLGMYNVKMAIGAIGIPGNNNDKARSEEMAAAVSELYREEERKRLAEQRERIELARQNQVDPATGKGFWNSLFS